MGKMNDTIFNDVLEKTQNGTLGLKHILAPYNISKGTFYNYVDADTQRADLYARAKNKQYDNLAEEIIDIADDGSNDLMTIVKGDESYEQENKEVVNRSKLRVDARKWLLSKLKSDKYGDKIAVEHEGNVNHVVTGMKIV